MEESGMFVCEEEGMRDGKREKRVQGLMEWHAVLYKHRQTDALDNLPSIMTVATVCFLHMFYLNGIISPVCQYGKRSTTTT